MIDIGRLKKSRLKAQMTQDGVANAIGIERPSYTAYESGRRNPTLENLVAIASIFDVSTDYLLGLTDDPTPPAKKGPSNEEQACITWAIDEESGELIAFEDSKENDQLWRSLADEELKKRILEVVEDELDRRNLG